MKSTTTILAILIALASLSSAQPTLDQQQLFQQANENFRAANESENVSQRCELYEKSIIAYETLIVQNKIHNPKLYYNLANAYLLKNDLGPAILNYRKAQALDPSNDNISKNLTYARSRTIDKFTIPTTDKVLHTLFFWHYDFSLFTRFITTLACFATLCLLATILILLGRKTKLLALAIIIAIILSSTLSSVLIETLLDTQRQGVITAPNTTAYQGDSTNYPKSFEDNLHQGTEFLLLEHRQNWYHIQLPDSTDCWINDNQAQLI